MKNLRIQEKTNAFEDFENVKAQNKRKYENRIKYNHDINEEDAFDRKKRKKQKKSKKESEY